MQIEMQRCFIIPIYNHHATIEKTVAGLLSYGLPIFVVDDGSNQRTKQVLQALEQAQPLVRLIVNQTNQGKGGAVMAGMRAAFAAGFTHALQLDADGQHDINDVGALWELAQDNPQALISGAPVYDESIPRGRKIGRYITHVWVWIETLSLSIRDTMCGFRVYPLVACIGLMDSRNLGKRMDFDIEIMVRLFWRGVQVRFYSTRVIYPQGGESHFQGFRDNLRISWLHTRLFFGMLPRSPLLLWRRWRDPR